MRKLSLCLFALVAVSVPAVQAHHYGHVGAFVAPVYQPVVAHQYVAPVVQQVEVVTKPVVAPVAVTLPYVAPVVAVQAVPYVAPVVSHGYSGAFVRRSQVVVQRPVVVRVRTFRRRSHRHDMRSPYTQASQTGRYCPPPAPWLALGSQPHCISVVATAPQAQRGMVSSQ